MKTRTLSKAIGLSVFLSVFLFSVNAQIKVESVGRLQVGPSPRSVTLTDANNALSMQLFGRETSTGYGAGSKLALGDFGINNGGWNVFLGEYGSTDTDQLWLHGKYGIYLTYNGSASGVIGFYDVNAGNLFKFNCDVYANGLKLTSDERMKENVKTISGSLASLQKLNGVSYNMKTTGQNLSLNAEKGAAGGMTDKEQRDIAFFKNWDKEQAAKEQKDRRLGFLAQDLKKVFPELVSEAKDGMLSVDYIGLIPVIVEGMKEQSRVIEAQSMKIKELESQLTGKSELRAANDATGLSDMEAGGEANAFLYQNVPNPFNAQTEIRYFLPESVKDAYICIFNMQGTMQKKIPVNNQGVVQVHGSELTAGMYIYALVADGKMADTKRMILTN